MSSSPTPVPATKATKPISASSPPTSSTTTCWRERSPPSAYNPISQAFITGHVERYEVPNILALKFVLHGALNGGASRSLRSDALGKSLSSALLRMEIEVEGSPHKELLRTKRDDILLIAKKYGVYNVRIFGSVARGEDDAESDIDFLVDMEPKHSLLDLGGFLIEVEDLLGCKVNAVTENGLRDRIRERVLKEAIPLVEI